MRYIDLHVHTTCSDGTKTPSQVIELALSLGLKAIAITDHDTVSGITEAKNYLLSLGNSSEFELIPGVEISTGYQDRDIHILGLYLNEADQNLNQELLLLQKEREERNEKIAANLRADGISIQVEDLTFGQPDTIITRAHFARYLTMKGYAKSNKDAFDRYLGSHTKYYVKRAYMTMEHAIQLIKDAGGIPVLAHPLLYHFTIKELEELVTLLTSYGLMGIEAIYSANTGFDEGIVRRIAREHNLIITGGSDYHGSNKPLISLGSGKGNLKIPETILIDLKKRQSN